MKMTMDELKQIIKDVLEEVQSEAAVDDLEVDELDELEDSEDLDSAEESEDSAEPEENAELDGDELPLSDEDTDSDKDEKDVEESVEPKQTLNEEVVDDEFSYYINGQEVDEETFCQVLKDEVASEFSADRIDAEYENAMACFYNVARHNTPGDIYPQGYGNRDFQVILKCFA